MIGKVLQFLPEFAHTGEALSTWNLQLSKIHRSYQEINGQNWSHIGELNEYIHIMALEDQNISFHWIGRQQSTLLYMDLTPVTMGRG